MLFHITEDHTVARLKVEAGEMTEAEAASSRYRHVLTRVLDGRPEHVPDVTARPARTGDRYLLCTSALATVDAQSIHHDLTTIEDPQAAATALVAQAGDAHDVTCVVVDVLERFPDLNGGAGGLSPAGRPRIG